MEEVPEPLSRLTGADLEDTMSFPSLNMMFLLYVFQILVPPSQTRNLEVTALVIGIQEHLAQQTESPL